MKVVTPALVFLFTCSACLSGLSQSWYTYGNPNTPTGKVLYGGYIPSLEATSNTLLFEDYRKGFLALQTGDTLGEVTVQYNYEDQVIAARLGNHIRRNDISYEIVKYLKAGSTLMFNPYQLGYSAYDDHDKIEGLVELTYVAEADKFMIGNYYYSILVRENYNPVLGTGVKEDYLEKGSKKFLFYNGKYYYLIPSNSKLTKFLSSELGLTIPKKADLVEEEMLIQVLNAQLK